MLNGRRLVTAVIAAAAFLLAVPVMAGTAAAAPAGHRSADAQLVADFRSAQQITRGQGATVAVLSSGVDANVLGLGGAVTKGPNYAGSANSSPVVGTLMAALIAGRGPSLNEPIAIRGLAPEAHILGIRIYPDPEEPGAKRFFNGSRWRGAMVNGIRYAAAHGASVIYLDSAGAGDWSALESAVGFALARRAVVVTEAGAPQDSSLGSSARWWPASLPGVITAGTADSAGRWKQRYSLAYPAVSVLGIGLKSGTALSKSDIGGGELLSSVTVAAAASLVKAQFPRLAPGLVEQAIAETARHYRGDGSAGIVNPAGALSKAAQLGKVTTTAATGPRALAVTDHFGGGPPPVIDAIRHNRLVLGGYAAAVLAGIACLTIALRLRRRRSRVRSRGAAAGM